MVFVYRPDVFDSQAFPAACIPTIYLSNGPHRNRRPERRRTGFRSPEWYVTLYLEPEVVLAEERYDERSGPRRERYAGPTVRGKRARPRVGHVDAVEVPRDAVEVLEGGLEQRAHAGIVTEVDMFVRARGDLHHPVKELALGAPAPVVVSLVLKAGV